MGAWKNAGYMNTREKTKKNLEKTKKNCFSAPSFTMNPT
jgi:hypothetical protein